MKKTISIALIILSFFIVFYIQQNLFTWFTIAGVSPNIFIILILFIGLFVGKKVGFTFGIIFGIYLDIITNKMIGQTALMLAIIGLIGEYLEKRFTKESRITLIFMVAVSTAIYEIGIYLLNLIKYNALIEIGSFIKIVLIEVLFNVIITIIIYPLIQYAGEALENIFKKSGIMSKYY